MAVAIALLSAIYHVQTSWYHKLRPAPRINDEARTRPQISLSIQNKGISHKMVKRHLCHCRYGSTKIDRKNVALLAFTKGPDQNAIQSR
jgi:hypothetical protein